MHRCRQASCPPGPASRDDRSPCTPKAAGRTYASYGGVYVAMALVWLWIVDRQVPDRWDVIGGAVTILGMAIIAFAPRS